MAGLFDNLLETSAKMADKVAKVTGEYIDKGKDKLDEMSLKNELSKAQKQLGVLVYALYIAGEQNDELVQKYIDDIARIEAELESYKTKETVEAEVIKFCQNCGNEVDLDDAFCKNCGNSVK